MKVISILILSIVQISLTFSQDLDSLRVYFCCQGEMQDSIRLEWIQTDIDKIKIANNLPDNSQTLKDIYGLYPKKKGIIRTDTTNLGFDLMFYEFSIYGGYNTYKLHVLTYKDLILKLNYSFSTECNLLNDYYREQLKIEYNCGANGLEYNQINKNNISIYREHYPDFQYESKESTQKKESEIYYFFADYCANNLMLNGQLHVRDDFISLSFDNIRYLILNKKTETLERILFSENPIGQIYATAALNYLTENSDYKKPSNITERVEQITATKPIIKAGILSCWVNKFDYDYYDIINDFNRLILEY